MNTILSPVSEKKSVLLPALEIVKVVDLGQIFNRAHGRRYFKRGEWLQAILRAGSLYIWFFFDSRWQECRVAFGDRPTPWHECERLSIEAAIETVNEKVREHVRQTT